MTTTKSFSEIYYALNNILGRVFLKDETTVIAMGWTVAAYMQEREKRFEQFNAANTEKLSVTERHNLLINIMAQ